MKKRLLSFVLALLMICTLLPFGAFADKAASGTCGRGVSWKFNGGTLTISGVGAMDNYDSPEKGGDYKEAPWSENYREAIKAVVIEKGVTGIGNYAFNDCINLTSVKIPDSIRTIGDYAFSDCSRLASITLPKGLAEIGEYAFEYCRALTEIAIPDTVKSIGSFAFSMCTGLKKFVIPAGVSSIGDSIFYECSGITDIYVAEANKTYASIGGVLFNKDRTKLVCYPCGRAGEYTVSSGVTAIEQGAFYGCSGITKINIPASVAKIGNFALERCENLRSINIASDNNTYASEYGVLFNKAKTELICCPGGFQGGYTIPSSVKTIKPSAFEFCGKLTSVVIPEGVTAIGKHTFMVCESLKSVTIPDGVTSIGDSAFDSCVNLTNVIIPASVTKIGTGAFAECKSLTNITLPAGLKTVEPYTFVACANLKSVTIPVSVKSVENYAFSECSALSEVNYCGSEAQWKSVEIKDNNEPLRKAKMFFNVKPLETNPFADLKSGTYCYEPVLWAYNHDPQITSGMDSTHFQPDTNCTRAQIVTFLWRAKGCPDAKAGTKCAFKDVSKEAFYYQAMLWALGEGITKGVDDTHFDPYGTCTRSQAVTFLWRTDGKHKVSANCPFKDVSKDAFYYDAMLWALSENITKGVDDSHFAPNSTCTREQIVTFLYRDPNIK